MLSKTNIHRLVYRFNSISHFLACMTRIFKTFISVPQLRPDPSITPTPPPLLQMHTAGLKPKNPGFIKLFANLLLVNRLLTWRDHPADQLAKRSKFKQKAQFNEKVHTTNKDRNQWLNILFGGHLLSHSQN